MKVRQIIYLSYCFVRDSLLRFSNKQLSYAFSISSHLTIPERVKIYQLSVNTRYVVEIGSYIGASACCFGASAIMNAKMRILCIDTWNNDSMSEGCRDTWSEFLDNTSRYSQFITPIRGLVLMSWRKFIPLLLSSICFLLMVITPMTE